MAETDLYDQSKLRDAVALVVKAVEDCERRYHDSFIQKVERRYLAYRGLAEASPTPAEDDDWHSKVTTPYVLQTCEGMLATMLEPNPRFNVIPRPKPEEPLDEVLARVNAVEAIGDTLKYALDRAHFAEVQRDFMQQDLIAGVSVLKDYWQSERRDVTRLVPDNIDIEDSYGQVVDTVVSHQEETTQDVLVIDDACVEVVDVRDFFWPSQAPNVRKAEYLIHRTWESYTALRRKGVYDNLDKIKDSSNTQVMSDLTKREMRLRNIDRTRDLVEVLEYWTPERVITVGNRTVLLKDRKNPFWNGRMPFTVCSSMPDAFQIPGLSVVEALAAIQQMLWTVQNQRLDVVRLLANVITIIRSDVDDPDAFEYAPEAQWLVEDVQQVSTLKIDPAVANITLQTEEILKGDLQNIMGGLPYASGTNSSTIDQQTATGVSIITTIAQRIIQARKQHYLWSYANLGKHFLLLYQQFLRDDRVIKILGQTGYPAYKSVSPLDIQGDFDVMIDVTSDSLVRQERRAEAGSLLQMAGQLAPIFAQSGTPLNLKAFMSKTLDAYDVPDKERYFLPPQTAPALAQATTPPSQQQPQQQSNGVTNPQLAAGPTSPSSPDVSTISPEASMQRMLAMQGGANNA